MSIVELITWLVFTSVVMSYTYDKFERFMQKRKTDKLLTEIEEYRSRQKSKRTV